MPPIIRWENDDGDDVQQYSSLSIFLELCDKSKASI
jgi:hypothetical protein